MRAFTLFVLALALVAAPLASAKKAATIGDLLDGAKDLSILKAALTAAGLDELATDAKLEATVFAPTDKAFAAALAALNVTAEEILADKELLTSVLSYHIVPGPAVKAADLKEGQILQTLLDGATGQLQFYTYEGLPRLLTTSEQKVRITKTDLEAGDAVVHLVDKVLLPGDYYFEAPAPAPAA